MLVLHKKDCSSPSLMRYIDEKNVWCVFHFRLWHDMVVHSKSSCIG